MDPFSLDHIIQDPLHAKSLHPLPYFIHHVKERGWPLLSKKATNLQSTQGLTPNGPEKS